MLNSIKNNRLHYPPCQESTACHFSGTRLLTLLLAALCLIGKPLPVLSANVETSARLKNAAKQYIMSAYKHQYEVNIDFGYLDSRLRLARCQLPLEAFFPPNGQSVIATSVGVRCSQPSWQIYIPVTIHAYTTVLTASHSLAKGTILATTDLQPKKREISRYRSGIFRDKNDLIGMVLKRPLAQGSVLTPREVEPKRLVRRGESVVIMAKAGGMIVRVQGQALMDGAHGDMIQVRNTNSGRKIQAEVVDTATVMIKM